MQQTKIYITVSILYLLKCQEIPNDMRIKSIICQLEKGVTVPVVIVT